MFVMNHWDWSEIWWEHHYQVTAGHFDSQLSGWQSDPTVVVRWPYYAGRWVRPGQCRLLGLLSAQGGKVLTISIIITVLGCSVLWLTWKKTLDGWWEVMAQYFHISIFYLHICWCITINSSNLTSWAQHERWVLKTNDWQREREGEGEGGWRWWPVRKILNAATHPPVALPAPDNLTTKSKPGQAFKWKNLQLSLINIPLFSDTWSTGCLNYEDNNWWSRTVARSETCRPITSQSALSYSCLVALSPCLPSGLPRCNWSFRDKQLI